MGKSGKDQIYSQKQDEVKDFVFDEKVADVFPDMIMRSVPGYILLHQLIPIVAKQYVQKSSNVYDLGCSLGEASISLARSIHLQDVKIIAIDNSKAMINRLEKRLLESNFQCKIETSCEDVTSIKMKNASLVILNYTLQFIEKAKREALLVNIFTSLQQGGAFILSEKISHSDVGEDQLMQELHENYKRNHDYSELEISQKREALDDVLVRDTHEKHIQRMQEVGFSKIVILSKYLNFITYLAIKE